MTLNEIDAAARIIRPLLSRELSMLQGIFAPTDPQGAPFVTKAQTALAEFDRLILFARSAANGKHPDAKPD